MSNKQVIKPKHIRAGVTIYRVHGVGLYVETLRISSKPYLLDLLNHKASFAKNKVFVPWGNFESEFSLQDAGIIPNTYNMSKCFSTKRAAQRYLNYLKTSPDHKKMMDDMEAKNKELEIYAYEDDYYVV